MVEPVSEPATGGDVDMTDSDDVLEEMKMEAPAAPVPKRVYTPEEATEESEAKKNEGNAALKAGEHDKAIALYTEAIEIKKSEGIYTNRAVAHI